MTKEWGEGRGEGKPSQHRTNLSSARKAPLSLNLSPLVPRGERESDPCSPSCGLPSMSARQLRLFKHSQPLLERLGAEFFRSIPTRPGVYIMSGEMGRVLYVGQSKNLRHRLATYKNANPDHVPRKVIRLVHAVRKIDWEECATANFARLRENELLRAHRPKFNSMNTYPNGLRQQHGLEGLQIPQDRLDDLLVPGSNKL